MKKEFFGIFFKSKLFFSKIFRNKLLSLEGGNNHIQVENQFLFGYISHYLSCNSLKFNLSPQSDIFPTEGCH